MNNINIITFIQDTVMCMLATKDVGEVSLVKCRRVLLIQNGMETSQDDRARRLDWI